MIDMKDTIMGKITIDALMYPDWDNLSREDAELRLEEMGTLENASNNVTYGSELKAIKGIAQAIGLDEKQVAQLINDINTNSKVSSELASEIQAKMASKGLESTILEILSVVHDGWVKDNGNKFQARPKDYQFVDLKLLDFKEASLDLLFLQPILEACGITVDRQMLEERFLQEQREYLQQQGIDSHEALVEKISSGAEFYPTLEGVETNKGVKGGEKTPITELLKNQEIVEKMAGQVEDRIAPSMLENAKAKNNELSNEAEKIKGTEELVKAAEQGKNQDKNPGIGE